jgi:hypothetical protein
MRKITPMILVTLLLVSALSSFDFAELEEIEVIEDTGARSGADAELIAITNPKETICPFQAACRNVMKVGDETTFSAYIQNSGDADITEMGYSVTVYLSDAAGNPSMVAKDAAGNELTWTNSNVICSNAAFCPYQTLLAGDVLGGGKQVMSGGASPASLVPFAWNPVKGLYIVEIIVTADEDVDAGNDAQQIYVTVEDWYDIELDLVWDSNLEIENGAGTKDWTLTVTAEGSDTFDPREVRVRLQTVGDVSAAQSTDGTLIDAGTTNIWTAGTSTTVDTYENTSTEPPTITTGLRNVLSNWTLTGQLTVDVANTADASYGLKASLVDYKQYGQWQSCSYTDNATNETVNNFCESDALSEDAYPSTDSSTIEGFASIFNDIRISQMSVVQGYNSDGTGQGTSVVTDLTGGDLNVGTSYFHVEVEHRGSESDSTYNWSVDFTVTDSAGGVITSPSVTTCEAVQPSYPMYGPLGVGPGATLEAYACMMVDLNMDGEYTFTADLVNDSKMNDAKPSNNDRSMTLNVRNNAPIITSLDLLNEGDLYFGQSDLLSMSVQVFDVDDPSSTGIEIEWAYNGIALPGCERANMQNTCSALIISDYLLNFPVSVTVYDAHGGETSQELMIEIWNDGGYTTSTASGMTVTYSLFYWGTSPFNLTATDGAALTGESLPDYSGTYDSVGVIDYSPSTTYSANDVLSQSLSVQFDKSTGATSLWFVNNAIWTLLSDTSTDFDATTGVFSYVFPDNSPVLTSGTFVLMGGSLALADIPTASITGFNAAALEKGAIKLNWNVDGTMLPGDSIDISICESVNCTTPFEIGLPAGNTNYTYSGQNTVHGTSYDVSVAVCNEMGCSTPIGAGSVTADSAVDGGAEATGLGFDSNGTIWTVSWTASGDQGDVDSWKVCYTRGTFTAAQMDETTCLPVLTGTSIDIDTASWSAGTYTYHFTAVPVDALGNSFAAGSMNSQEYQRDGDTEPGEDVLPSDKVSSGVPTWTWGIIGGVVVIAFIAGAFILSRGGSGDEGKDWDY